MRWGRPKRTWKDFVREDCQARKLNKEDAVDRCKWRKVIKEVRWPGWVWAGECFFWYRPTRVVTDKQPLNGCCCRCCSEMRHETWPIVETHTVITSFQAQWNAPLGTAMRFLYVDNTVLLSITATPLLMMFSRQNWFLAIFFTSQKRTFDDILW